MNSKLVGDFFFPPQEPPIPEETPDKNSNSNMTSTPLDDLDSDAEIDEEEVSKLQDTKVEEEKSVLNEPESEPLAEDHETDKPVLEHETREEPEKNIIELEKFPSNDKLMNIEPDESDEDLFNLRKEQEQLEKGEIILREMDTERLHYLFKILRPAIFKNETTVGYFNKIVFNLYHFYPLEIFSFCLDDTIIMECFIQNFKFKKFVEILSKILNFEKKIYYNEKQVEWVKKYDEERIEFFNKIFVKFTEEKDSITDKDFECLYIILGDLFTRYKEVITGERILKEVAFSQKNLRVISENIFNVKNYY